MLIFFASLGGSASAADVLAVVRPALTDELLANPGMGWETFHRTSRADKNLPAWLPSTVYYARWSWRELEPKPGNLNTQFIDQALKEAHDADQQVAFRVKGFSPRKDRPYNPDWITADGGRVLMVDYDGSGPVLPIPDLVHRFIKAFTHHEAKNSNFFHRCTTGAALISAIPRRILSLSSALDCTRICRRNVWAILPKSVSTSTTFH